MLFPKGSDPKRLLAEQMAFEEAERKKAEARAQVVFDNLIDSHPIAMELFDPKGDLVKQNKAAERLLGKIPPPGLNLFEERGLKRTGLLEPQLKRLLAGARIETPPYWFDPTEIGLVPTTRGKVYLRVTAYPLFDAEGQIKMLAFIYEDLTELKKAEESLQELKQSSPVSSFDNQLPSISPDVRDVEFARRKIEKEWRESEERYRALVDSVTDACIIRLADDGRILNISPSVQELFGVSREAVLTDNSLLFANVHPDDIARVKAVEAEAKKIGVYPPHHQFRVVKKPGAETVWLEMRGKTCNFASRRTFEILVLNITPEKQLEELLTRKEKDITTILESPIDGIIAINQEWVITSWSKGAEKETRISTAEAKGKRLWEVYPEMEKSGMALPIRKTLLERQAQKAELFYQDGRERIEGWFSISTYPIDSGAIIFLRNITARKRMEQAWQDAESRLRALLENEQVLIAIKDTTLRYISANHAAEKTLNPKGEPIIGKTDAELFPATVNALLSSHDQEVLKSGKAVTLKLCLGDPKAENSTWISLTKQPWRNASGETIGIIDIGFDTTREIKAQEELARRRKAFETILNKQKDLLQEAQKELTRWQNKG